MDLLKTAAIFFGIIVTFTHLAHCVADELTVLEPVLKVDSPGPTADKPQSKLWFARGSWWAWLPTVHGSSIWKRSERGWERQTSLDRELRSCSGHADVCAEGDMVRAVVVDRQSIAVVTLNFVEESRGYAVVGKPVRFSMPEVRGSEARPIETATIARDENHRWWIAYPWQNRMWVRSAPDVERAAWTEPFPISSAATEDDLCAITTMHGGVGVVWSDQAADAVYFRFHRHDLEPDQWEPIETVAQGQCTADDHINTAVGKDGTLYVATKNSVDRIGEPQLALHVRDSNGRWANFPYAPRTERWEPTRPVVLIDAENSRLFLAHSLYSSSRDKASIRPSQIAIQSVAVGNLDLDSAGQKFVSASASLNNITGCKSKLPKNLGWIVLASDSQGGVYEVCLE